MKLVGRRDDAENVEWRQVLCACGAEWHWWGKPGEGAFLERLWRRAHAGPGHRVLTPGPHEDDAA
ncbi:MAG TPA: hypothetical protein VFC93_00010 [Chloroflexota bacterium]|nr:hypothetical protein [Chloroflexota bacterium]